MEYIITGSNSLSGSVSAHGSKNSVLPILAASLLHAGRTELYHVPDLLDVNTALDILRHLGAEVTRDGSYVLINATDITRHDIPRELMNAMRSSVIFLGAVLGRMGKAVLSLPGGCELGPRPIDMHLSALRKMGAEIEGDEDCPICEDTTLVCSHNGLHARDIHLIFPSVGATENIMIAACASDGVTRIKNPAREPEIVDLANFINAMGGRVKGAGERVIIIEGMQTFRDVAFNIPGDRIVAGTLLCAAAATGGYIGVSGIQPARIRLPLEMLEGMGCEITALENSVILKASRRLKAAQHIETAPYPAFPTDLQPPFMALSCVARGKTTFIENIFDSRYAHIEGLKAMGADIKQSDREAVVRGVKRLRGCDNEAKDLRGGAALIIAALAAEGTSNIGGIHHIERGYEKIDRALCSLGADIRRA